LDLARPELALTAPGAMDVLMVLTRAERALSACEIARRVGITECDVTEAALAALMTQGVVVADGDEVGHTLNREHVLTMALEQLAAARGRVVERLRMHIATWDPAPVFAAVVGSVARGEGGPGDDVDILLVRPAGLASDPRWAAQRDALGSDVRAWTGNAAHLIEMEDGAPVALRGAAVILAGDRPD
jgi:hypothetical protein